jgi:chemosensory pili system protein ChpA (sensor histidine kinase/response regulator)
MLRQTGERATPKPHNMVMLLASGNQRVALHVDELLHNQEVAVKDIGPQLAAIPGVAGATISSRGDIVFILNPLELARRENLGSEDHTLVSIPGIDDTAPIMVVDDSITVRKVTSRLLSRAGYQVATARDGIDALEQIQVRLPAAILLDIEMPRMDGFEFTKAVRGDPRTRMIPIIMISSRTADKHRQHAAQLGVNLFLGKPFQDDELLRHLANFTALDRTVARAG